MLSQDILKYWLDYNSETGIFVWKRKSRKNLSIGIVAGCRDIQTGYIKIQIQGKSYYAHRLAFLWMTGSFPKNEVDHKNGLPSDNRWENLRDVQHIDNQQNQNIHKCNNTTGYKGVCIFRGRFRAQIQVKKKTIWLGDFDSPKKAHDEYLKAKSKYHRSFIAQ